MSPPRVVVLGAGVAGLTTALALARRGMPVEVLERDNAPAPYGRRGAAAWRRDGVPQVEHGHVFGSGCHRLLAAELPDVLVRLRQLGAREIPLGPAGADPPAVALGVRRPLFDWVLRRVAEREPGVEVHSGVKVTGLCTNGSKLSGVRVAGGVLPAEVAVNATGAGGPVEGRLGTRTAPPSATAVTWYSQCYALRWPGDPTELNLGAAAGGEFDGYACRVIPADNDTFTVTFDVPADTAATELAALRMPDVFRAAAARIPLVEDWVHPAVADSLTGVSVLAGWPASTDTVGEPLPGLLAVGDARCSDRGRGVLAAMGSGLACAGDVLAEFGAGDADLDAGAWVAFERDGLPADVDVSPAGPSARELAGESRVSVLTGMGSRTGRG